MTTEQARYDLYAPNRVTEMDSRRDTLRMAEPRPPRKPKRKIRFRFAERDDVEKATVEWDDNVISCRTYGHLWRPLTVTHDRDGYIVTQACSSCGNRRHQAMDARGFAQHWNYSYVEGYLTKGLGRIGDEGRAALRLAALRNMTIQEAED